MYYKLDENKNVIPSSLEEWASFIEGDLPTNYRQAGRDVINNMTISTIFIGLCHNYNPRSKIPIVFETMIFDIEGKDIYQERYSTWKQAEKGHQRAIQWLKEGCKDE